MTGRDYACGLGPAIEVVGGKWKVMILCELDSGALRFGELKRRIAKVSEKMLIQQLRELERDDLVLRKVFNQVPPHVEYSLTTWGETLNKALSPVADWGEKYSVETGRYPG